MRKWMLNIHLYGGLLCAPYLMIFGFSSLHFNHHFGFVDQGPENLTKWEAPLNCEPVKDNNAMAEAVRDGLGLMGWPLPWKTKRDPAGNLEFEMERPGKSYTIRMELTEHRARVEERKKGVWQVVNSLHALGAIPNSKFVRLWGWYTELCTAFVLFASVSGLYLWLNSRRERRVGILALVAALLVSLGLMVFVVRWG
jgi:hypothetical protein